MGEGRDGLLGQWPDAAEAVYLAIQRSIEGVVFVVVDREGPRSYRGEEEWNEAARSMLHLLVTAAEMEFVPEQEAFRTRGRRLWDALPGEVRDLFMDGRPIYLSPDELTSNVPLELMCAAENGDDWVGLNHVLARTPGVARYREALQETAITGPGPPSMVLFADPRHRLPEPRQLPDGTKDPYARQLGFSEVEATALRQRLGKRFEFVPEGRIYLRDEATLKRFLQGLAEDPWIVHFTGHGGYADDEPYLCLADTGMLPARGLPDGRFGGSPLVMLNCCLAGLTRPMGGSYRGLVEGFLSRGAAAVVASSFPVYDFPSMHFSTAFYERLLAGQTVGEAILGARRHVAGRADAHPLHWALFAPWGNVNARLGLPERQ